MDQREREIEALERADGDDCRDCNDCGNCRAEGSCGSCEDCGDDDCASEDEDGDEDEDEEEYEDEEDARTDKKEIVAAPHCSSLRSASLVAQCDGCSELRRELESLRQLVASMRQNGAVFDAAPSPVSLVRSAR